MTMETLEQSLERELRAVAPSGIWLTLSDGSGEHVRERSLLSFSKSAQLPLSPLPGCAAMVDANALLCRALRVVATYLRGHALGAVEVRPSFIAAAGQGLFAAAAIPCGALICVYSGRVLSLRQAMALTVVERDYVMGGFGLNTHVDASGDAHSGVYARYINDNWNVPGGGEANVEFIKLRRQKKALVVARRAIAAGEELYARYGEGYWAARGFAVPAAAVSPPSPPPAAT